MRQPSEPPHSHKLGLIAVALVKARFRGLIPALARVRDELEPILVASGWFPNAKFSWVTISIRLGLKNDSLPRFGRVNNKYGDLPLTLEIDAHEVLAVDGDAEYLYALLKNHTLRCLAAVAKRYQLPLAAPATEGTNDA